VNQKLLTLQGFIFFKGPIDKLDILVSLFHKYMLFNDKFSFLAKKI
jgi:hypothetical protein